MVTDRIIPSDSLLNFYLLRHMPSQQNIEGFGSEDTDLASQENKEVQDIRTLLGIIGIENIDEIILGKLKRHRQSFEQIFPEQFDKLTYSQEDRLTACFAGPLVENPPEQTEEEYNLERFKPGEDGLYHHPSGLSFDPKASGIFPFDALYSDIYVDKVLRSIVFPDDASLATFDDIEERVLSFQRDLIEKAVSKGSPVNILGIGSCSINGFNLEKAAFGTTGEHMKDNYGSEERVVFPQQHDEIMVLGYTEGDLKSGKNNLSVYEGNVKITNFVERTR